MVPTSLFEIKPRRSSGDSGSYTNSQRKIPREVLGQTERNTCKERRQTREAERKRESTVHTYRGSRTKGEGRGRGEKKEKEPLRSASRCRVHRFRSPPSSRRSPPAQTHIHEHTTHDVTLSLLASSRARYTRNIAKRAAPGTRIDVPACQVIVCNCRLG